MKKIFLFFLLLSASGAFAQVAPSVYKLPGDTVKVQNLLYVKGVKVDSTTYSTKTLLSTYLTKAQVIAGYYPLSNGNTDATNIASNTASIALLAPLASPVFTGGVALSGNITKAVNYGTTGLVFSAPATTVTSTTSTGTIATQGSYVFGIPTLAASSATTLTNASTVYIDGAPTAGTNVTIGTAYGLYVNTAAFFTGQINASGGFGTTNSSSTANFLAAATSGVSSSSAVASIQFAGSTNIQDRVILNGGSSTTLSVGNSYGNLIVGSVPVSKAASGTHAWLANVVVNPLGTIGAGASTVTNTASLYVGAGISAGTNNYGIYSAGTIFSAASITGTSFKTTPVTFSTLPTASEGIIASITDGSTATPGATVTGSGSNHVAVYYNGTNWIVL